MTKSRLHAVLAGLLLAMSVPALADRIPAVKSQSLAGDVVALPEALRGKTGVLVLGFSRGSQEAVTEWGRRLAADYRDSTTVLYYEMPMLAGAPRFLRGTILRQMKSTVPERAWPRFVPITEDEKAWRTLAQYANGDDAYVLLLDGEGNVRWRTAGRSTDATYGELKQRLAAAARP